MPLDSVINTSAARAECPPAERIIQSPQTNEACSLLCFISFAWWRPGEECSIVTQVWQTQEDPGRLLLKMNLVLTVPRLYLEIHTMQSDGPCLLLQHVTLPMLPTQTSPRPCSKVLIIEGFILSVL